MTDPRKVLLCSFCITLTSSVEEGKEVSCTVQVSKENEGDILGYPSKKIITGQSVWDIKHLNDRMHGITYIWQSQAPVSINSCLTIEGLSKKCISEEVPEKKRSCLPSMGRFISVFEVSKRTNPK